MQSCTKCKQEKPLSNFYANRGKLRRYCKECILADNKEWRRTHKEYMRTFDKRRQPAYRLRRLELGKAWKKQNPEKNKAHVLVHKAIKCGALVRPSICGQCHQAGTIQAHHEDYSKPLEVLWLCTYCHNAKDHTK